MSIGEIKTMIHQYLIQKTDFLSVKDSMTEDQLRVFVDKAISDLCAEDQLEVTMEMRVALIRSLVSSVVSLGPIRPLVEDPEITEIMINGASAIYVQKAGKIELTDVKFESNEHLLHSIQKILAASGSNKRVDESSPYVDFSMTDGSRVNVLLPPCSLIGPVMTIRKFANISEVDQLLKAGTLNDEMATLLIGAMKAKLNVVFCGATGTGKTTTLNVLSKYIPDHERIITIEDTPELRLHQDHVVTLQSKGANVEGKGAISIRDLFVNSLRMRPDRIIVGEVRSEEMLDLIESISSGHSGSLAIVHAESPEDCFSRMVTMMLMTGIRLSTEVIYKQIARAIDLIVHIELFPDGKRRLTYMTDVDWDDAKQDVIMHDVFRFEQKEDSFDDKIEGEWVKTNKKPSFFKKFEKRHIKLPDRFFD
ncbi:MAG: CpaF family protein [Candidatus Omnitrophica bacterium]|nr:CpaF family protein [Candidatus Omnitrophota bacterium]